MSVDKNEVLKALSRLQLPDGGDLVSKDFIRAVTVHAGSVRFVIEAPSPEIAKKLAAIREAAEKIVLDLDGITSVTAVVTAHEEKAPPPNLKLGRPGV